MRFFSRSLLATLFTLTLWVLSQPLYAQSSDTGTLTGTVTGTVTITGNVTTSELQRIVNSGTLRVGVNPNFEPFSFIGDGDKRVGVDIDIADQLAKALDVALEVTAPDDFSELIPMLEDGKIDLILAGMSITFERAKSVAFTDPYFDTGMSLLMNVGSSAKLGIENAKNSAAVLKTLQARGNEDRLKIAVTEGKAPALEAKRRFPKAQIISYATNEEAAQATANGQANLMIHDEIFLKVWYQKNQSTVGKRLRVLDPPIKPDFYGIALRQGDSDWLQLLNVFVRNLRADGQVLGYLSEYLPSMSMTESPESVIPIFDLGDME